jgi:integrase
MEMVPTWTQVCDFADAVADRAGGLYRSRRTGERLGAGIRVSAGSGLRLCELLGLVPFEVNLDRGLITVRHQLDRYRAWRPGEPMPTSLPKHHNPKRGFRSAVLWELVRDDVGRLLHDSGEGPLLPPPPNVTWWADGWGRLLKASADDIGWRWPPHYLRHHYGSYCLAPVESGGRGMTAVEVQHSLGHTKLSTTLDTYVQQTAEPGGWV